MPTREEIRRRLAAGEDYAGAARQLGVPPGKAYLIATGVPADGSDSLAPEERERPGLILGGAQRLLGVPADNPSQQAEVRAFIHARVAADGQMRRAAEGGR